MNKKHSTPTFNFLSSLFITAITLSSLPTLLVAQEKPEMPPGQIWHNGDRAVPIWFSDEKIAILDPLSNGKSLKALNDSAQLLIPGAKVIRASDAGSIVQLPSQHTAKNLLNSADTVTRTSNRYAAVYQTSPEPNANFMIQTGELVVFGMPGVSKEQLDSIVLGSGKVQFLKTLVNDKAYLYSCPSDTSCLAIANSLYKLPLIKYAYPNWIRFMNKRGKLSTPASGDTDSVRYTITDPLYNDQWHISNTGQGGGTAGEDSNVQGAYDQAIGGNYGFPVVIGVVDDGLDIAHEDLNFFTGAHIDFRDGDSDPSPGVYDAHGTAVGGVAAADGFNNLGVSGIAPEAVLAGIRLIGGGATDTDEARALNHELSTFDFIDIYNNSWGPFDNGNLNSPSPLTLAALETGVQTGRSGDMENFGAIYVWAGGNGLENSDNSNYDGYANSRYTIAVGASTNTGVQSWYSEPGANLIVNAPSDGGSLGITTTDVTGSNGYTLGNYTSDFGGTSSAAPLVAGVVGLMFEANTFLNWRDVQKILALSAEKNDPNDSDWKQNSAGHWVNHKYGFGRVDATAVVNLAMGWSNVGTEVSGSVTIEPDASIPDSGGGSVILTIPFQDAIDIQHVYVKIDSDHTYWGDLEMILTSPDGTQSVLSETHNNGGANLAGGFTFSSMRHLDENSAGDWTLKITDNASADVGLINLVKLEVFGTAFGDANGDGNVNVLDIIALINAVFNHEPLEGEGVDCNNDGTTNVLDVICAINIVFDQN